MNQSGVLLRISNGLDISKGSQEVREPGSQGASVKICRYYITRLMM